jgi:hypothetical protein
MCKDDQEKEPEAEGGLMLEQKPAERDQGDALSWEWCG